MLHTLHSTLHTLHFTLRTLQSTLYTLHSTLHTLHPALYALHSTLHNPHFTLYTLHSPPSPLFSSCFTLCTPHLPQSTVHWYGNRAKVQRMFKVLYVTAFGFVGCIYCFCILFQNHIHLYEVSLRTNKLHVKLVPTCFMFRLMETFSSKQDSNHKQSIPSNLTITHGPHGWKYQQNDCSKFCRRQVGSQNVYHDIPAQSPSRKQLVSWQTIHVLVS